MGRYLLPFFLFASFLANAQEMDVFDLAAKYNESKKDLTELEIKKRKVLSDIYSIEKETNKLVLQKTELDEEKLTLDGKLANISKKIVEMEAQVRELIPELIERLSFSEQINGLPWIYAILTSQSLIELDTTFATAQHINEQQSEKVTEFLALVHDLKIKKEELTKTAVKIVKVRKDLSSKEMEIEKNQKSKKSFLADLEKKLTNQKENLKKIQKKGKKAISLSLFQDLEILFGSGFFDQKGELPHPISVPFTHDYGLNKGLLPDNVQLHHKGYFYSAIGGEKVSSIANGRVRFAGPALGYGKVVVLDHGSRYYTVYANLADLAIKLNQEIKQGDLLGTTGHDHIQFGSGLYFEIRHFSQPQNPESWLKKQPKHLANLQ